MTTITFDTLKFTKRLTEAGFTKKQAETLAEEQAQLVNENLVTKRDLKELEVATRRDIKELEQRLTIRLGGMLVTGIVVVATLVKLL